MATLATDTFATLATDTFVTFLREVPSNDLSNTWAPNRTLMLRKTSNTIKNLIDKMNLPVNVLLNSNFWKSPSNGTNDNKLHTIFTDLEKISNKHSIIKIVLPNCDLCYSDIFYESFNKWSLKWLQLKHLDINYNSINFSKLSFPTSLLNIVLSGNWCKDEEEFLTFVKNLEECISIKSIKLSEADIDDKKVEMLVKMLSRKTGLRKLRELNLFNNDITELGAKSIVNELGLSTTLTCLNLGYCGIGNKGFAEIFNSMFPALVKLNLCKNDITEFTDNKDKKTALALAILDISRNEISAKCLNNILLRHFEKLQELDISSMKIGNFEIVELEDITQQLSNLSKLTKLYLCCNQINDTVMSALSLGLRLNTLNELDLSYNLIKEDGLSNLSQCINLIKLNLNHNHICDIGATTIGEILVILTNISNLDLSSNKIGDVGVSEIFKGLEKCTGLTKLQLYSNKIGNVGATKIGILRNLHNLIEFSIYGNQIGKDGAAEIASVMVQWYALTDFNLSFNPIGNEGIKSFANALSQYKALKRLNLCDISIDNTGVNFFAEVLTNNITLTYLNLGSNPIEIDAISNIEEAIKQHNLNLTVYFCKKNKF
jgi:Ran GTPase-activating protein (RanGAP) involved in mRNA processing and transport